MKLYTIVSTAFLLSLASCSIFGSNLNHSDIVGNWKWIKSTGGFAGHTITPDSTGYSQEQLRFSTDHKFLFFRADTLVTSGQYSLSNQRGNIIINYNAATGPDLHDQWIEFNNNDTLILKDRCADCYTSTYRRTN